MIRIGVVLVKVQDYVDVPIGVKRIFLFMEVFVARMVVRMSFVIERIELILT